MNRAIVATLHMSLWVVSIPLLGLLDTWLVRVKRIDVPSWTLYAFVLAMLVWALWIFSRCFSYRPFTMGKALALAGYSVVIAIGGTIGLLVEYGLVVMFLGGE